MNYSNVTLGNIQDEATQILNSVGSQRSKIQQVVIKYLFLMYNQDEDLGKLGNFDSEPLANFIKKLGDLNYNNGNLIDYIQEKLPLNWIKKDKLFKKAKNGSRAKLTYDREYYEATNFWEVNVVKDSKTKDFTVESISSAYLSTSKRMTRKIKEEGLDVSVDMKLLMVQVDGLIAKLNRQAVSDDADNKLSDSELQLELLTNSIKKGTNKAKAKTRAKRGSASTPNLTNNIKKSTSRAKAKTSAEEGSASTPNLVSNKVVVSA